MQDIQTSFPSVMLSHPNPERDAPFALQWFTSSHGKETLLLMGNPEHRINTPTFDGETNTIRQFLDLEKANKQLTWMIRYDDRTIGATWIELVDTEYVASPALHIMIGDKKYRDRGIGKVVMQEMIHYGRDVLKAKVLYSRHLTSNTRVAHLNESLGFIKDGEPYKDTDDLEFQNVRVAI